MVTQGRRSGNPVVLGFQGRSQLERRYGIEAETLLSQPATKIFLKTSEPHAAKWISDAIGEVEIESWQESRSQGTQRDSQSQASQIGPVPLVMASQIGGLRPLRGYLKLDDLVTPLEIDRPPLREKAPGFIARSASPSPTPAAPGAVASPSKKGGVEDPFFE
jgi:type IV secretory pathway TraG/TraD family ATPase VirD4